MEFYWIGLTFWLLIGSSTLLFIWGLWKKSWKAFFISGTALIIPSLYFFGAENWFRLLILMPFISFSLSYLIRRKGL